MTDIVYNKNGIAFDIDTIATDLNGKMDKDGINATASVCVEGYQNGTSWYRVYSDGWCEQGGSYSGANAVITFLKPFVNTNYTIVEAINTESTGNLLYSGVSHTNKTATSVTFPNSGSVSNCSWQASGYIR